MFKRSRSFVFKYLISPLKPVIPTYHPFPIHIYSNNNLEKSLKNSPRVNPSAGETKRVPKVEKAPDTGYIEDISPLRVVVEY